MWAGRGRRLGALVSGSAGRNTHLGCGARRSLWGQWNSNQMVLARRNDSRAFAGRNLVVVWVIVQSVGVASPLTR